MPRFNTTAQVNRLCTLIATHGTSDDAGHNVARNHAKGYTELQAMAVCRAMQRAEAKHNATKGTPVYTPAYAEQLAAAHNALHDGYWCFTCDEAQAARRS